MYKVLENNNNQILINKLTIERIKEITNITVRIVKIMEDNESTEINLILKLKFKLEVIKEKIVNFWAKANITNSYILSNEQINTSKNTVN